MVKLFLVLGTALLLWPSACGFEVPRLEPRYKVFLADFREEFPHKLILSAEHLPKEATCVGIFGAREPDGKPFPAIGTDISSLEALFSIRRTTEWSWRFSPLCEIQIVNGVRVVTVDFRTLFRKSNGDPAPLLSGTYRFNIAFPQNGCDGNYGTAPPRRDSKWSQIGVVLGRVPSTPELEVDLHAFGREGVDEVDPIPTFSLVLDYDESNGRISNVRSR